MILQDEAKTKEQLISELAALRQRVAELEALGSERKRMEEALRESEERYRTLFEQKLEGVVIIDEKKNILLANQAAAKMFGFDSVEEVRGANPFDFIPQEERERALRALTKDMFEHNLRQINGFRLINKAGEEIWISALGTLIEYQGKPAGLVSFRDITNCKRIEEALREKSELFEKTFTSQLDAIFILDVGDPPVIIDCNPAALEMFGYTRQEVLGRTTAFLHVDETTLKKFQGLLYPAIEKRGFFYLPEFAMKRKDATVFPTEHSVVPLKNQQGERIGWVSVVRDITGRKRVEAALQQSEKKYRDLVENLSDAIYTVDEKGVITYVSPVAESLSGYSPSELIGRSFTEFVYGEDLPYTLERFQRGFSGYTEPHEHRVLTKSGDIRWVRHSSRPVFMGDRIIGFHGVLADITERKLAEEKEKQLQQELYLSSRLAAIGELAAGVAHEIDNPLTGILGFSQRLLRKSTDEEVSQGLEIIHSEAQRAAKVIENLLTFARRREPKKQYCDINDILLKALELRAYELKTSNIEIDLNLAPSLPKIMVDFQQIQEVFLNIILNAEQAMSEANRGGRLSIKTQPVRDYIKISFADDGPGIPAEHFSKLFNPFFTTRREKGGTGLGLCICHGIVAEHGGRIYAKSKLGKGATFFVELPVDGGSY